MPLNFVSKRREIRRIVELRAEEKTSRRMFDLLRESKTFQDFTVFFNYHVRASNSRHLTDLVAAFFMGSNKRFLEVGAHHPVIGSDTYLLEKKFNWTGVQIEPNHKMAELLRRYRNSEVMNFALTSDKSKRLRLDSNSGKIHKFKGERVDSLNLEELIILKGHFFDAMFIDIEGGEYDIINDSKFNSFNFEFMSVERIWNYRKVESRLTSLGYKNFWKSISGYESWWLRDPKKKGLQKEIDFF